MYGLIDSHDCIINVTLPLLQETLAEEPQCYYCAVHLGSLISQPHIPLIIFIQGLSHLHLIFSHLLWETDSYTSRFQTPTGSLPL